jgi:hypothetical protein
MTNIKTADITVTKTQKSIDIFYGRVQHYKEEAQKGNYHNPYDVCDELTSLVQGLGLNIDDLDYFETIAWQTGNLFWSM